MAQWPNFIERQLLNALNYASNVHRHYDTDNAEQLWAWQGKCRISIKESLGTQIPAVYSPPKARMLRGKTERPEKGQLVQIETENDNVVEINIQTPPPLVEHAPKCLLKVSDEIDREYHQTFCEKASKIGLTGVSFAMRNAGIRESIGELAEIYLGLGRCYGGAVVQDLFRVTDYLEQQFNTEGEPMFLMLSGLAILPGLAFAAIDQRISGVIVDFRSARGAIERPTGFPPFLKEQYIHLGANPLLSIMECVATRPMMFIGEPAESKEPWIKGGKTGVLSFAAQRKCIEEVYESENASDQLMIVSDEDFSGNEGKWIRKMVELFSGSGKIG
jgi:hypothetical protein